MAGGNTSASPGEGRTAEHIRQLDSLRTLAILTVMCSHWLPPGHPLQVLSRWGTLGVFLFFSLSGFLITGILIRCRDRVDAGVASRITCLRRFYIRRFLRIFPLYYLVLFVAFAINVQGVREAFAWHVTYSSNFLLSSGAMPPGPSSVFWTLAVEEQFYLFWPWLVLFLPRRWLLSGILLMLFATRLLVSLAGLAELNLSPYYGLLPSCIWYLALGALLAVSQSNTQDTKGAPVRLRRCLLGASAPVLAFTALLTWRWPNSAVLQFIHTVGLDPFLAMFFTWLVSGAAAGFKGPFGWLLNLSPIVYLGRISYGLYVYHMFITWGLRQLLRVGWIREHLDPEIWSYLRNGFAPQFVLTVAVAMVSWHLIERPINDLKRHFPYSKGRDNN